MKSDQEPAVEALNAAVMELQFMEILPEESPVYEHQANGVVENAAKRVGEQVRTMKLALEEIWSEGGKGTCNITMDD